MLATLTILCVSCGANAEPESVSEPLIVSRRDGRNGEARFKEYAHQFDITLEKARTIVEAFRDAQPEDERSFLPALIGMVNDEYIYAFPRKSGFSLVGYRVNATTGVTRFVSVDLVRTQYGKRFPNGHVPGSELSKYRLK